MYISCFSTANFTTKIEIMNPPIMSLFKIRVSAFGDSRIYSFIFPLVVIEVTKPENGWQLLTGTFT